MSLYKTVYKYQFALNILFSRTEITQKIKYSSATYNSPPQPAVDQTMTTTAQAVIFLNVKNLF